MRFFIILNLILIAELNYSQNNARLYSANGEIFKVLIGNKEVNVIAEANVLVENISSDTLVVKIVFENNKESEAVIYLLDKGKKTKNKEYNYRINPEKGALKITFAGIHEIVRLPDRIVPKKPVKHNTETGK